MSIVKHSRWQNIAMNTSFWWIDRRVSVCWCVCGVKWIRGFFTKRVYSGYIETDYPHGNLYFVEAPSQKLLSITTFLVTCEYITCTHSLKIPTCTYEARDSKFSFTFFFFFHNMPSKTISIVNKPLRIIKNLNAFFAEIFGNNNLTDIDWCHWFIWSNMF